MWLRRLRRGQWLRGPHRSNEQIAASAPQSLSATRAWPLQNLPVLQMDHILLLGGADEI